MSSTAAPDQSENPAGTGELPSVFKRQGVQAFLFIGPAILLLGVLIVYPMVRTSIYSFANLNSRLEVTRWIGFDNYTRLFTKDKSFLNLEEFPPSGALVNNVKWMILYTSLSCCSGAADRGAGRPGAVRVAHEGDRLRADGDRGDRGRRSSGSSSTSLIPNLGIVRTPSSRRFGADPIAWSRPAGHRQLRAHLRRTSGRRPASRWWCCRRR